MSEMTGPADFTIEYSWEQNFTRKEGDCLASATEGSVLASVLNSPLLYINSSEVPIETKEALYKLGVKNIYLVNLGEHLSSQAMKQLKGVSIAEIDEHFTSYEDIYSYIRDITESNDVIFSTYISMFESSLGQAIAILFSFR